VERIGLAQAAYYVVTGMWPLLHMPSFELVAGRKKEHWLVNTVGVCVTAIGVGLGVATARRELTPSMRALAALACVGLAGIDTRYALGGRIRRIYLADAVIEIALALLWASSLARQHDPHRDGAREPRGDRDGERELGRDRVEAPADR
jgi:hypothetical protein